MTHVTLTTYREAPTALLDTGAGLSVLVGAYWIPVMTDSVGLLAGLTFAVVLAVLGVFMLQDADQSLREVAP